MILTDEDPITFQLYPSQILEFKIAPFPLGAHPYITGAEYSLRITDNIKQNITFCLKYTDAHDFDATCGINGVIYNRDSFDRRYFPFSSSMDNFYGAVERKDDGFSSLLVHFIISLRYIQAEVGGYGITNRFYVEEIKNCSINNRCPSHYFVGNNIIIASNEDLYSMFVLKITSDYQVKIIKYLDFNHLYDIRIGPSDIFFGMDHSKDIHVFYLDKNDQIVNINQYINPENEIITAKDLVFETKQNLTIYQVYQASLKYIKNYNISNCQSVSYDGVYIACIDQNLYKLFKMENFNLSLICSSPYIQYVSSYMIEDQNGIFFTGYNVSDQIFEYRFGNSYISPSSTYMNGKVRGDIFTVIKGENYKEFSVIWKRFGYQNYKKISRLPGRWEANFKGDVLFIENTIATLRK